MRLTPVNGLHIRITDKKKSMMCYSQSKLMFKEPYTKLIIFRNE
jgi:hypothetical protein